MSRRQGRRHTAWCAADHRCNLAEHRSAEILVDLPDHGREYGEIRARIALNADEYTARVQLRTALTDLRGLLSRAAQVTRRAA